MPMHDCLHEEYLNISTDVLWCLHWTPRPGILTYWPDGLLSYLTRTRANGPVT